MEKGCAAPGGPVCLLGSGCIPRRKQAAGLAQLRGVWANTPSLAQPRDLPPAVSLVRWGLTNPCLRNV